MGSIPAGGTRPKKAPERVPFLLPGARHLAAPNAAACGRDFRFALCEGENPDGFPLTLLFPSDPLGLRAASLPKANSFGLPGAVPAMPRLPLAMLALCVVFAEFAKGKLVWLAGRSPGNAAFPHTRPLPPSGGDFCTPLQEQLFATPGGLISTSGTIIRTVRKISPL